MSRLLGTLHATGRLVSVAFWSAVVAATMGDLMMSPRADSGGPQVEKLAEKPADTTSAKPEVHFLEPAEVLRGLPIKVSGKNLDQATEIRVRLNEREFLLEKPRSSEDGKSFTFRVPADLRLGRYTMRAVLMLRNGTTDIQTIPVPAQNNQIRVVNDATEKVKVNGIFPLVGYPEGGVFGFRILGEGFSPFAADNELVREDGGTVKVTWVDALPAKDGPTDKVYGQLVSTRQLDFWGLPQKEHEGKLKFRIRVGDSVSDALPVTLARVPKVVPWIVGLGVVAFLAAIVMIPVTRGLKRHQIGKESVSPLYTFLLDPETDTMSLSKFQLYVWTGVAVFGYAYLTVARSLIQGEFEFAPIPEGLPGIIGISAGTAVLAAGINSARGPKGAGEESPSLADLITTGAVVVPERFQFLIWTILGALAFLFLVAFSDPATIRDLPKIPEGFLYLMGVSSFGYLGGRLARKSGPIIDTIVAAQGNSIVIDIQGRGLSKEASFTIDDMEVTCELVLEDTAKPPRPKNNEPQKDAALVVLRKDEPSGEPDFALTLRLRLWNEKEWLVQRRNLNLEENEQPGEAWVKEEHRLCLVNPDGQKAVLSFTIKPKSANAD
jgi:hypothetical protein